MKNSFGFKILAFVLMVFVLLSVGVGCGKSDGSNDPGPTVDGTVQEDTGKNGLPEETLQPTPGLSQENSDGSDSTPQEDGNPEAEPLSPQDLEKVKPDESGKIMVVMFHRFIEAYSSGDRAYTTTLDAFRSLLEELYAKDYRLINMSDYLENNISVPAGCIPMIFTFDDGTAGQFNLVNENGELVANKNSAVGIMEEFNRKHPDFGLKGTFFVNLGTKTFDGEGTMSQRLQYLIDKGFEIGNHTFTHVNLDEHKTAESIQQEIGQNQQKMLEIIPGYQMKVFSLPRGLHPIDSLKGYVEKGEYEGTSYKHQAVVLVGAEPALSPVSVKAAPLALRRVRSSGLDPVDYDLAWWLKKLTREQQYISDGNPDTVTVPKAKEGEVDPAKLQGKKLITY